MPITDESFNQNSTICLDEPGMYLMKSARGEIVYIGKAEYSPIRCAPIFRRVADHDTESQRLHRSIEDYQIPVVTQIRSGGARSSKAT